MEIQLNINERGIHSLGPQIEIGAEEKVIYMEIPNVFRWCFKCDMFLNGNSEKEKLGFFLILCGVKGISVYLTLVFTLTNKFGASHTFHLSIWNSESYQKEVFWVIFSHSELNEH